MEVPSEQVPTKDAESLILHPGPTEIEWLSDLKPYAERIGAEVLGRPIHWRVETNVAKRRTRSDVVVEQANDRAALLSGEAKRPNDPQGINPLVADEVDNAVGKAETHGVRVCFTTNFHQIAVLDAGPGPMSRPLARLHGDLIEFIPRTLATSNGWWKHLPDDERDEAVRGGLRILFERFRLLQAGHRPHVHIDEVVLGFFAQLTGDLLDPLHRRFLTQPGAVTPAIRHRALTAGLDPNSDQESRYLVAQGIFEVLSAALFHRVLQDHFSRLRPILAGTSPVSSAALGKTVLGSLGIATRVSGDYEPILTPSEIAVWVLREAPPDAVPHWSALLSFVDRLDLSAVTSDVLGSIFERLIAPERRHEMGQHYTQPRLARSMAKWGLRHPQDEVLDPACGAGTFLVETYREHAARDLTHDEILERTYGNDLDPFAVHLASINLVIRRIRHGLNYPSIRLGDAFDLQAGLPMLHVDSERQDAFERNLPLVDLVITNPPYARTHSDETHARQQLVTLYGSESHLPETTGINQAAWFVLLGQGLLKQDGRMAFVLPSAVLQNDNLKSWRAWIRRHRNVVIWHTEDDVWFSDARVAPCVVLFEGVPDDGSQGGRVAFVNVLEPASGDVLDNGGIPTPALSTEVRDLRGLPLEADLLIPGTKPDVLARFERCASVSLIGQLSGVHTGAGQKLGHTFFKLTDLDPDSPAVVRTVEGLGVTIRVNRKYLTPILSGPKDLVDGEPKLLKRWLLTLPTERPRAQVLRAYLRLGESQGVAKAPSVSARGTAWWSLDAKVWDIAVPMSSQFRHQVAWLDPRGAATNNFNVLSCQSRDEAELIGASLASAFGALSRLYISGEIGCEGARRILLSQFVLWPVLNPPHVDPRLGAECTRIYREFRKLASSEIDVMPPTELSLWRELTFSVARAALGPRQGIRAAEELAEQAIEAARSTVVRRRRREAMALGGRTRQARSSGATMSRRVKAWAEEFKGYGETVELLTVGPAVSALRAPQEVDKLSLFGDPTPLAGAPDIEKELAEILGVGFEAAWPDPEQQALQLEDLVKDLRALQEAALDELLGQPPASSDPARETWDQLAEELVTTLRRQLLIDVRRIVS